MSLKFNSTTVPTNGAVKYNNTSLNVVKFGTTEVWRKQLILVGSGNKVDWTLSENDSSNIATPTIIANDGYTLAFKFESATGYATSTAMLQYTVDLTNYSKISFTIYSAGGTHGARTWLYLDNTLPTSYFYWDYPDSQAGKIFMLADYFDEFANETTHTVTKDISGLTGTYNLKLQHQINNSTAIGGRYTEIKDLILTY